tara:strand:+ start:576 stop:860 length:285 start_codon:yes stop_codon:yes gene_type:complete
MKHLPHISVDIIRKWSNKCPKCGSHISYRLSNGEYGATSAAICGKNIASTRDFPKDKSERSKMKHCEWKGKAVRMRDGGVRFYDTISGRFLIEW